jgi:hypothetical protein
MVHKKIEEQLSTLFWKTLLNIKQTHKFTGLYQFLTIHPSLSRNPHCPPIVLLMSLNIILQGAASAHLLHWPNITRFEKLYLSIFISGTCHVQQREQQAPCTY